MLNDQTRAASVPAGEMRTADATRGDMTAEGAIGWLPITELARPPSGCLWTPPSVEAHQQGGWSETTATSGIATRLSDQAGAGTLVGNGNRTDCLTEELQVRKHGHFRRRPRRHLRPPAVRSASTDRQSDLLSPFRQAVWAISTLSRHYFYTGPAERQEPVLEGRISYQTDHPRPESRSSARSSATRSTPGSWIANIAGNVQDDRSSSRSGTAHPEA